MTVALSTTHRATFRRLDSGQNTFLAAGLVRVDFLRICSINPYAMQQFWERVLLEAAIGGFDPPEQPTTANIRAFQDHVLGDDLLNGPDDWSVAQWIQRELAAA